MADATQSTLLEQVGKGSRITRDRYNSTCSYRPMTRDTSLCIFYMSMHMV